MKHHVRLLGCLSLFLSGCESGVAPAPRWPAPTFDAASASSPPLVQHVIAPNHTDAAIDRALDDHIIWLDTSVASRHRLLVFLPGTGQRPAQFGPFLQEAARLGFHSVGLSYPTGGALAMACPIAIDPAACFEDARLEIIDGIDRSALVNVSPPNSIDNRLAKLLRYLDAQYPEEGWSQFVGDDGQTKWPLIAVSGLSKGGGEAAMIAKLRLVDRVVMFSSVPDSIGRASAPWVGGAHATPSNRYYGLAHLRDGLLPPILAGWDSLGMAVFGPDAIVEANEPPYGWTHMLITDLAPIGGLVGQNAHASTATDGVTPLAADGSPALSDAWGYMLTGLPRHTHSRPR